MGDRKYEFNTESKAERDKWYVSLRNSRKTAKEIKKSFTKKPRNITKILKIYESEGITKLRDQCEKEKDALIKNYKDLKDFDLFEGYYIKNLQDSLYETLDACVIMDPPNAEVVKVYVEVFNTNYLLLVQKFWSNCYQDLDVSNIDLNLYFNFNMNLSFIIKYILILKTLTSLSYIAKPNRQNVLNPIQPRRNAHTLRRNRP